MRRTRLGTGITLAALASLALAGPGTAQDQGGSLSVEGRVGTTLPVADLGDHGAESGLAFTADLLYNFHPNWSAYLGWGIHDFNCDGCPDDLLSSGPHAGAKYILAWEGAALPWARAGLMLGQADDFRDGQDVQSPRTGGLQLATGIDLRVGERLSIVPSLWLTHYSAEFPDDDQGMTYFLLDVGAHYHF